MAYLSINRAGQVAGLGNPLLFMAIAIRQQQEAAAAAAREEEARKKKATADAKAAADAKAVADAKAQASVPVPAPAPAPSGLLTRDTVGTTYAYQLSKQANGLWSYTQLMNVPVSGPDMFSNVQDAKDEMVRRNRAIMDAMPQTTTMPVLPPPQTTTVPTASVRPSPQPINVSIQSPAPQQLPVSSPAPSMAPAPAPAKASVSPWLLGGGAVAAAVGAYFMMK
jgi:hypothetical protein